MSNEPSFIRQSGILDPDKAEQTHINIIGCGTVGSNAAVQLARAGFGSFSLYDHDEVEAHNMPSQDFHLNHIGVPKVEALEQRVNEVSKAQVKVFKRKIEGPEFLDAGPVILAVDSMDARGNIFEQCIKPNPLIDLCVDFRMGGLAMQALTVNPQDEEQVEAYAGYQFDDSEAAPLTCGTQSFAPVGAVIGGLATTIVARHVNGEDTPLLTNVDLAGMYMVQAG